MMPTQIRGRLLVAVLLTTTTFIAAFPLGAQQDDPRTRLVLQRGTVQLDAEATKQFVALLMKSPKPALHAYIRLRHTPNEAEHKALRDAGIHLLSFLNNRTYYVTVSKRVTLHQPPLRALVEALAPINPEHKIDQDIREGRYERFVVEVETKAVNYVLNPDGTLNLTIRFFSDVSPKTGGEILKPLSRKLEQAGQSTWNIIVNRNAVLQIAANDEVQSVDPGPLPLLPLNDRSRVILNVDAVQAFNTTTNTITGLGGSGVQIGIVDTGVDDAHNDTMLLDAGNNIIGSRVLRQLPGSGSHGTHVAGIAAGNGFQSNGAAPIPANQCGSAVVGTPFSWRGMAPQAGILDYNWWAPDAVFDAISNFGLDVSNHSYVVTIDGNYTPGAQIRDQLVRGDSVSSAGQRIPARPQVAASGNNGTSTQYGELRGYYSLLNQTKNDIVVGNWNGCNGQLSSSSSIGPSYDGRIKPDVVAPGTSIVSMAPNTNGYTLSSGTSMASPALAGVIALMLQQYAQTYGVNLDVAPPRAEALRSTLIQTATDVDWVTPARAGTPGGLPPTYAYPPSCPAGLPNNPAFCNVDGPVVLFPGPDFATGWGLANAQAAVNLIQQQALYSDSIPETGKIRGMYFNVPAGTPNLQVTMAWDDVEASTGLPLTASRLVNDLDLELVDPTGTVWYPHQLNQQITDPFSTTPIPDNQQYPGIDIQVNTSLVPTLTPRDCDGVGDPTPCVPQNDYAGNIPVAQANRARDHLNNIEQVTIANPVSGNWRVRVIGFRIPDPTRPQSYTVAGIRGGGNQTPNLSAIGPLTVVEGETVTVTVSASDPDGNVLTMAAAQWDGTPLPAFVTLSSTSPGFGTLTVSPRFGDAGIYRGILVSATDNGTPAKFDGEMLTITVRPYVPAWIDDGTVVRLATTTDLVGIGTKTPGGKLHVDVDNDGGGDLFVEDAGPRKGNVGVGTTNPAYKLTLGDQTNLDPFNYFEINASTWTGVLFHGGGRGADITYNHPQNYMTFGTSPGDGTGPWERMRITSAGNVGIGTLNPGTNRLAVEGDVEISAASPTLRLTAREEQPARLRFEDAQARSTEHFEIFFNASDQDLHFRSDEIEMMKLTNDGLIFFTPKNLHETHPSLSGSQYVIGWNHSGGRGETTFYQHGGGGWKAGYDFWSQRDGQSRRLLASLEDTGNLKLRGSVGSLSDAREKTNIRPITNSLTTVLALRGVHFNWKDKKGRDDKTHVGMIAQEVLKVFPDAVTGGEKIGKEEELYSVHYDKIVPLLVEALKQQQRNVDRLTERIAELESRRTAKPAAK